MLQNMEQTVKNVEINRKTALQKETAVPFVLFYQSWGFIVGIYINTKNGC